MISQPRFNTPELWRGLFPHPKADGNKYDRGHAVILGGPLHSTGAAKLAARAALRIGAGLVSVACTSEALPAYAATFQAVMTKPVASAKDFENLIRDPRVRSVLVGPGAGVTDFTRACALAALHEKKPTVLDADGLTVFAKEKESLFSAVQSSCILTPHEGEFERLFGPLAQDRLQAVQEAARLSRAVVILKGAHTLIVASDGRAAVNTNAPPYLATAGTGDVLAGICAGLLAQGMEAFAAACASVWIHAEAACAFGLGLIAEDLPDALPGVVRAGISNE